MASLIEMKTKAGGSLLIQISERDSSVRPVTALDNAYEKAVETLDAGLDQLCSIGKSFTDALSGLGKTLESAELELGLQATGKGKLFVVEAEAKASFKVKLVFKPEHSAAGAD
jgi:hypothetical protein